MFFPKRQDVHVPFYIFVINKQKHWFVRKNWIASKPKKFLTSTISGKKIQRSKIYLKHSRNKQKVMLILVITKCYYGETSNGLFPKADVVTQTCSVKKMFLEILQNLQENICARVSSLIKLQVSGRPGTGVFLWILQNF